MVYSNLFYRVIFSFILIILYFISINNNYILFSFVTLIYLTILYECVKFFKIYFYFILLYLFLSFYCFISYFFNYFDFYFFNILIFTIILFDSFSYFFGLLFGKHYIFKKISPKKTLEGYLGGILSTNIILIFLIFYSNNLSQFFNLFLFINILILISIFGDLFQSFFKRQNNIKNSSSLLPGHGGFFDRFDSFISGIFFLYFYSII